jgi:hypothetical protein
MAALARDPKPGEVVWVTTTDKGHEAAKELVLQVVGGHERSWAASETAGR